MDGAGRLEAQVEELKEQVKATEAQTRTLARRLRWWQSMAGGLLVLGALRLALPSAKADDSEDENRGLAQRVAALEQKLAHVTSGPDDVTITGANLRIVNGLETTRTINGLGNLIVGYNELRGDGTDNRTGSHNVVVGESNNFSRYGGLVVGLQNEISGNFASVSAGERNTASGELSSVCGGQVNTASGFISSVSGGAQNTASGQNASVSGGDSNIAGGFFSSVSGGFANVASGQDASVSGGANRTASGTNNWAAGPFFANN